MQVMKISPTGRAGLFLAPPQQTQTLNTMSEKESVFQKREMNLINVNDGAVKHNSLWVIYAKIVFKVVWREVPE